MTISGTLATPAQQLRQMLAESSTWQTALGVSTPAAALGKIAFRDISGERSRPHCVITPGTQHTWELIAGGGQNYLRPRGSLFVYLAADTPPQYWADQVEAEYWAASLFGSIIDDIAALAAADSSDPEAELSHLSLVRINLLQLDESPESLWASVGRFWWCAYQVDWGDQ
jgi:hypothetical protein